MQVIRKYNTKTGIILRKEWACQMWINFGFAATMSLLIVCSLYFAVYLLFLM